MDAKENAEEQLEFLLKIPSKFSKHLDYYTYKDIEWWTAFKIAVFDASDCELFFGDVLLRKRMKSDMAVEVEQTYHFAEEKKYFFGDVEVVNPMEQGMEVKQTDTTKQISFFIALLNSEINNLRVLDCNYFWTYGYIPVWKNEEDALEALQNHVYGTFPHRPTRPSLPLHPT